MARRQGRILTPTPFSPRSLPHPSTLVPQLAAHDHYDRRIESLVMERRTVFADDLAELSPDDRRWLAEALHAAPHKATTVRYERQHTGFCREILATRADVERLYRERILSTKPATPAIPTSDL